TTAAANQTKKTLNKQPGEKKKKNNHMINQNPPQKEKSAQIFSKLGPVESQIMEFVWRSGEVSVRDVHLSFNGTLAYTTLMTTLDRLHKKGLLARRKDGRAFFYTPQLSPQEFERGIARSLIDTLLGRS